MKKRCFLIGTTLLLLVFVVGCGIPQEQYDAVLAERDQTQQELQSVKAELAIVQGEVSGLTSNLEKEKSGAKETQAELETVKSELETVQAEYDTFKADLKSSFGKLDSCLAVNFYVLGINSGLCLDDLNKIESMATSTTARVANVADSELKSLWESAYVIEGGRWDLKFVPFERFMGRLAFLLKNGAKSLRDKLAE